MGIRESINNNSSLSTIMVVGLMCVTAALVIWRLNSRSTAWSEVYYYDLNTQKVFIAENHKETPFDTGSGTFAYPDGEKGAGVSAMIYACDGSVVIEDGMSVSEIELAGAKLLYVSRMSPRGMELQNKIDGGVELSNMEQMEYDGNKFWMARPNELNWTSEISGAATGIISEIRMMCQGKRATPIKP